MTAALAQATDAELSGISAVSGHGLQELFDRLAAQIDGAAGKEAAQLEQEAGWHPLREG